MNIAQIEENLQQLMKSFHKETFIYDLLLAYGLPKASITRLQKGALNMSNTFGEVSWKQKVFFKELGSEDLNAVAKQMHQGMKHRQRFIVATNYTSLIAIDTKTEDKLDIELSELPKHFDFFLPWAGMEKATYKDDNPADVKAAEKMAKLFDVIKRDNPDDSPEFVHGLNVFLSRLLFCFFADDTGIFTDNQVNNAIASHTQEDGSDLDAYLTKLFEVLDTEEGARGELPSHLSSFPYVNGSLFRERFVIPKFGRRSRQAIIDSGEMDWSEINPDIFGSMFQAVISVDQRGSLGQHYTSVPNIMKVIEPLFLNDLYEAFEKAKGDKTKLGLLLQRLHKIKIFDPACGSGNFLIIAYKEIRRLEMKILKESGVMPLSGIHLSQFYGIELDDFAHEIAQLALWLAEHQMNLESFKEFGQANATLPLGDAGQITRGNACRLDWEVVCPKKEDDEIYILGNPPYVGSKGQDECQKSDMEHVFNGWNNFKKLDYISCWFKLAMDFIVETKNTFSFVSTNSISMGEQISILWPYLESVKEEIFFAYPSFKWDNNAKKKAGVTVIIVGIGSRIYPRKKNIYYSDRLLNASNISPYLIEGKAIYIHPRRKPISDLPVMERGSQPTDNGNLIFSEEEYNQFQLLYPDSNHLFRIYMGADDFLNKKVRFCLWVNELLEIEDYPELMIRIMACKEFRLNSKKEATRKKADVPHLFDERKHKETNSIMFPIITSERRDYIPIGFLDNKTVISNKGQVVYNSSPWIFGLLTSKLHNVWIQRIAGRLETRIQYSNTLCYNNFPFPGISKLKKEEITQCVFRILEEREKHSEKTLAQLYDPDKMPESLREAHRLNDEAIECCYRSKPFKSDEERLEYLFKLYDKMVEEEKNQGGLFEKPKKTRKRKTNA